MDLASSSTKSNVMANDGDDQICSLPSGTKVHSYLEGNANVLLRIDCPEPSCLSTKNMLLRLRKEKHASKKSTEQAFSQFQNHIKPLFSAKDIVKQSLVRLSDDTVEQANQSLKANAQRSKKRHGSYAAHDQYGLLLENMMKPSLDELGNEHHVGFFEFKPKWLVQSPSAPKSARRCRTCALREMRSYDREFESHDLIEKTAQSYFCPLDLVSGNFDDVLRAARGICSSSSKNGMGDEDQEARANILAKVIARHPLLHRLRDLQERYNSVSLDDFADNSCFPEGEKAHAIKRGISMTLRDCTVLLAVSYESANSDNFFNTDDEETAKAMDCGLSAVKMKLCDLDFKDGSGGKVAYWKNIERRLTDEGWYMGRRALDTALQGDSAESSDHTASSQNVCFLARNVGDLGRLNP